MKAKYFKHFCLDCGQEYPALKDEKKRCKNAKCQSDRILVTASDNAVIWFRAGAEYYQHCVTRSCQARQQIAEADIKKLKKCLTCGGSFFTIVKSPLNSNKRELIVDKSGRELLPLEQQQNNLIWCKQG